MRSLERLKTWDLAEIPVGKKVARSRKIFEGKRDGNENITRNKERLVAKIFSYIREIDFTDVFYLVSKYVTVCLMFALSVNIGWLRLEIDVKNALLSALL